MGLWSLSLVRLWGRSRSNDMGGFCGGAMFVMGFVLLGFGRGGAAVSDLKVSVPECCRLGINWEKEGLKCQEYPGPVLDVPNADQELCLRTIQLCCEDNRRSSQCQKGLGRFKADKVCPSPDPNACEDVETKCCDLCRLGWKLGESKADCSSSGVPLEEQFKQVMQNCCFEVNPHRNPNRKPNKSHHNQSTLQPTADYDNYEDYGLPTPVLDNLCDLLPGQLCAQICVPTHGSYYCKCEEGYVLMEDHKTCQKNATAHPTKPKPLLVPQVIIPNPEKPVPLHKPKENPPSTPPPKNASCQQQNDCEQECIDTESGHECGCRAGYALDVDGKTCEDVNECLNDTFVCDPDTEECVNEIGGYTCRRLPATSSTTSTTTEPTAVVATTTASSTTAESRPLASPMSPTAIGCPAGFENVSGNCTDIDECNYSKHPEVCDPDQDCINKPGGYECRCKAGFQENPNTHRCEDINECQTTLHNCLASQRCDNTIGSFQCIRFTGCGTGYTLNSQNGQCEDDDECTLGTDNCRFLGPNYICRNTLGSFRCERKRCLPGDATCDPNKQCPAGYVQNESGVCVDLDECTTGTHNCHPYADRCINRVGGFECRKVVHCPKGYEATANGCKDVDECATNKHTCKGLAECKNDNGGYTCSCPTGYQLAGDNSCQDINECSFYMCPYNSKCINTPGSYICNCNVGFRNIDETTCQDLDECSVTPGICDHTCINVFGSFRCTCKTGFKLHENNRTCIDLDECEMFRDQRLCIGECVNIPGSFSCRCPPGYYLGPDGRSCQDIDECARNPCKEKETVCLNTRGGFKCNSIKCPPNYVKDHEHKNRCKRLKTYCRKDDTECLQQPLTYSFNFITFVSMLPIPPVGHLDLFTMRGPRPLWTGMDSQFNLDLLSARPAQSIAPATINFFRLRNSGWNQRVISLVRPIPGPQEIELQLTMKLYDSGTFVGSGVAKLMIHVSEFEY